MTDSVGVDTCNKTPDSGSYNSGCAPALPTTSSLMEACATLPEWGAIFGPGHGNRKFKIRWIEKPDRIILRGYGTTEVVLKKNEDRAHCQNRVLHYECEKSPESNSGGGRNQRIGNLDTVATRDLVPEGASLKAGLYLEDAQIFRIQETENAVIFWFDEETCGGDGPYRALDDIKPNQHPRNACAASNACIHSPDGRCYPVSVADFDPNRSPKERHFSDSERSRGRIRLF